MFYLWWIWDYNIPTFKVMQYGWVSMLCFVCEHPSVCFGVYLYVRANGWWWREPGKNRETVPAVFSWVGFPLRASNKPLHFLSRTHHLDLKTRTRYRIVEDVGTQKRLLAILRYRLQHNRGSSHDIKRTQSQRGFVCTSLLRLVSISSCFASSHWLIGSLFHSYGAKCLQILFIWIQEHTFM